MPSPGARQAPARRAREAAAAGKQQRSQASAGQQRHTGSCLDPMRMHYRPQAGPDPLQGRCKTTPRRGLAQEQPGHAGHLLWHLGGRVDRPEGRDRVGGGHAAAFPHQGPQEQKVRHLPGAGASWAVHSCIGLTQQQGQGAGRAWGAWQHPQGKQQQRQQPCARYAAAVSPAAAAITTQQ